MMATPQKTNTEIVSSHGNGVCFCTFFEKKANAAIFENESLQAFCGDLAHCSFSGKEKDSETGYHYFGARYYNSDLSLWLSVDPMSDKYPSLSPYNYCAWNPMKLVDPDGNKPILHFYGKRSRAAFERIVNSGLGGQFQANLTRNSNGSYTFDIVATQGGGNAGKLSDRQQAFYGALESCINAKAKDGSELNYNIDVHYGSSGVMVGKYQDNAIDVADMEQFNDLSKGGATKQGKLIHELVEQREKAYFNNNKGDNMGWNNSHKKACLEEGTVNGNKRVVHGDKTLGRGVYQEKFIQNGKEHYVKIINTPIIGVEQ